MSLASLVGGVTGNLGSRFNLLGVFPGILLFLFLFALISMWTQTPPKFPDIFVLVERFEKMTTQQALLIALVVITLALITQPLQIRLIRLFEGYWGTSNIGKKLSTLGRDIQWEKREAYGVMKENPPEFNKYYPKKYDHFLPTSLGNILRAAESTPGDRYALDAIVLWPKLYPILPDTMRGILNDKRNQMDIAVRLSSIFLICSIASLIFYFIIVHTAMSNSFPLNLAVYSNILGHFPPNVLYTFMFMLNYSWWLTLPAITLLLSWLSYKSAKTVALEYGEAIKAAFDLYRFDLLKCLHMPLPANSEIERERKIKNSQIFFSTNTILESIINTVKVRFPTTYNLRRR